MLDFLNLKHECMCQENQNFQYLMLFEKLFYRSFMFSYAFGGHAQNRTGIKGFAILCVTIPPRGQFYNKID